MTPRKLRIERRAERLLELMDAETFERAAEALTWLGIEPEPDGENRVKLPEAFPHPPSCYQALYRGIVIVYRLTDDELEILALRSLW